MYGYRARVSRAIWNAWGRGESHDWAHDAAPLPPDMPRTHRIHAWTREGVAWRLIPDRARGRVLVTQLAPVGRSPAHSVPATDQMDVDVEDITGAARRTRIVMGIQPLTFLLGPTIP